MRGTLGQNQFAGRTHASLKQMPTVSGPVGASHHHVRMHLWLFVVEGDVSNQRKQLHLLVENAGWIILFRFQVEPSQLRVRKSADRFKTASPQTLMLRELLQYARDLVASVKDQGKCSRFVLDLFPAHDISFSENGLSLAEDQKRAAGLLLQGWIN